MPTGRSDSYSVFVLGCQFWGVRFRNRSSHNRSVIQFSVSGGNLFLLCIETLGGNPEVAKRMRSSFCMSTTLLQPQSECVHEVLEAARRGDRDAFTALVTPHAPQIRRIACRLTRNVEDAEDVCQESLLKAFTKLDQFVGTEEVARDEFRFWLMKIATNCAIDFMRRKQASRLLPLEECDHLHSKPYQAGTGGWGENPETSCARQERLSVVVDAITRLPAGLRNACLLRNIMELTTKEAAERLGISTIALRLRLFRAHGQLRKRLGAVRKHCRHDHLEAKPRNVEYNSLPRNNVQTVLRYPPKAQYVCGD